MRTRHVVRRPGQRGAVAVEFALVVPLLLLLVFGMIQYGFYFWSLQGGSSAAREAARRAAVGRPTACDAFRGEVAANLRGIPSGDLAVTRTYATLPAAPGSDVRVSVSFDSVDLHLPFVPFLDGGRVTQSATARVDFVPDPTIGNCA